MPCYDDHEYQQNKLARAQLPVRDAMLCGVLTSLINHGKILHEGRIVPVFDLIISEIDEKKAGVTKTDIITWWNIHCRKDAGNES